MEFSLKGLNNSAHVGEQSCMELVARLCMDRPEDLSWNCNNVGIWGEDLGGEREVKEDDFSFCPIRLWLFSTQTAYLKKSHGLTLPV